MKKIRVASALIATALLLPIFGCDTSESSDGTTTNNQEATNPDTTGNEDVSSGEPDRYSIMSVFRPQHEDFDNMPIVDQIMKDANVVIDWELVGDAASSERKNIAISTGNMPDAMLGLVTETDVQENPELFMVLNDYIDTLPNVSKIMEDSPETKTHLTFLDGNIYSFPFVQEREYEGFPDQLYINTTWLDNLDLEMPTTYEEYADVLRAFKTQDPNGNNEADEIPLTMMINHSYFGLYSMYGLFGRIDAPNHLTVEDGTIIFTADKEEWKDATIWFRGLYEEGLIDPEGFTQDRSMLFAKGKSDPVMIGSTSAFLLDNVVGADRMSDYEFLLLEGVDGEKRLRHSHFPVQSRTNSVVNANLENPEGLMRFFDTALDEGKEYSLQSVFGLIGKQIIESDSAEYKYKFAIAPDGLSQDDFRYKDAPSNFPTFLSADSWASIEHAPDVARKEAILEENRDYLQKESLPPMLFLDEELSELADITSTIQDYVNQQQALWITAEADIDADWDSYLSALDTMGLPRFVEIYQLAYDRYYAN